MSRTENSLRNIKFSIIGELLLIILGFLCRKVFLFFLTTEHLGLSSLFGNILTVLSLAELGIGSALVCLLYRPISQGDDVKTASIMHLYKKVYIFIGIIVLFVGSLLTPFLGFLIKEMPDIPNISIIYLLFVVNSGVSYFFSYKRELIIAYQKRYLYTLVNVVVKLLMYTLQIILLFATHNYLLFLCVMICSTMLENISLSIIANKFFPNLMQIKPVRLSSNEIVEVKDKVFGSAFHKIGDVLITGTDNILISKIVGIAETGLYANYILIINVVNTILATVYNSLLASFGNLGSEKSKEYQLITFERMNFISACIIGFSASSFLSLLNPFISLWIGDKYVLDFKIIILIVINFYLIGMRRPIAMMRDALGLFSFDKYIKIPEVLINFFVSIVVGLKFGIVGIVLGTILSNLCTTFWSYPIVLYKRGFECKATRYYKYYIMYLFVNLVVCAFTLICTYIIQLTGIWGFAVKALISCIIFICLMFFFYRKNEHFTFFKEKLLDRITKGNRK